MDWLKALLGSLPLESTSEILGQVILWWIAITDGIDDADLPIFAYLGGSCLVLILLHFGLKFLPKTVAGLVWIAAAAILLTPGSTIGESGGIAPAIIGVAHSVLMGETGAALTLFLPILAVMIVLVMLGAVWQLLKAIIVSAIERRKNSQNLS